MFSCCLQMIIFQALYQHFLISDDILRCSTSPEADGYKGSVHIIHTQLYIHCIYCRCCNKAQWTLRFCLSWREVWVAAFSLTLGFSNSFHKFALWKQANFEQNSNFLINFLTRWFFSRIEMSVFCKRRRKHFFCDAQVTRSTTERYCWWKK